ncbi:unnamed protein product [Arctogadus glacialis]
MMGQQRGFCWIVNNSDFSLSHGKHKNLEGTYIDEESLRRVFTWLGFQVEVLRDATRYQMLSSMRELASRDHSGMDCVACVVLSHGLEGGVYGVDGEGVWLEELTDLLNKHCASLRGKPTLFFMQASKDSESSSSSWELCSYTAAVSTPFYLTAMATVPPEPGAWFIQSLCQNLLQMVPCGEDLESIVRKAHKYLAEKCFRLNKGLHSTQHSSRLEKPLVFPLPEGCPPSLPTVPHSLQAKQHPSPHPALQPPPVKHSLQAKQHPSPHPALQPPPVKHSLQAKQHPSPHPALQPPPVKHSLQAKQHPSPHPALQPPPVKHSLQAKQHPAPHPALQPPPVKHSLKHSVQVNQPPAPHQALQLLPVKHSLQQHSIEHPFIGTSLEDTAVLPVGRHEEEDGSDSGKSRGSSGFLILRKRMKGGSVNRLMRFESESDI